jgi:hypothetical protein
MSRVRSLVFSVLISLAGCSGPPGAPLDAGADARVAAGVPGLSLMRALGGLWTGPATMTRLGDFPLMNVDFRAATDHFLFGRVDLDAANSLRLALDVETIDGSDVLVFRNGGLFSGLSRDTRTILIEADEASGTYRFCATDAQGGCGYTEALFTLTGADRVVLDVTVRGMPHLRWDARRAEARALPSPFPASSAPQGTGEGPFPPMPSLEVEVSWPSPLAAPADAWIVLATEPCLSGGCTPSRWLRVAADAGATSATATIDQIHAGDYLATAFLDRDRDAATTLAPDAGDGVSRPDSPITIAPSGTATSALPILLDL